MKKLLFLLLFIPYSVSAQLDTLKQDWWVDGDSIGNREIYFGHHKRIEAYEINVGNRDSTAEYEKTVYTNPGMGLESYEHIRHGAADIIVSTLTNEQGIGCVWSAGTEYGIKQIDIQENIFNGVPPHINISVLSDNGNVTQTTKGVKFIIGSGEGSSSYRSIYTDFKPIKTGIEYGADGYVTNPGTLIDKRYTDKNIMVSFSKTSLPSASLPVRMIFVTNATGGACPAYNDGTNWRRFSDNSIIN